MQNAERRHQMRHWLLTANSIVIGGDTRSRGHPHFVLDFGGFSAELYITTHFNIGKLLSQVVAYKYLQIINLHVK
jgi:hypothetical protein